MINAYNKFLSFICTDIFLQFDYTVGNLMYLSCLLARRGRHRFNCVNGIMCFLSPFSSRVPSRRLVVSALVLVDLLSTTCLYVSSRLPSPLSLLASCLLFPHILCVALVSLVSLLLDDIHLAVAS
jgi:hypothetical protein